MAAIEKNIMRPRGRQRDEREVKEFDERVVEVQRVSRVVKGGRRIRFRALMVLGDHKGRIGLGVAKATEVSEAVRKATAKAKKSIITIPVVNGTIPHEVSAKFGASKVMLKPATPGTTIVAGGSVRVVCDLVGITDVLAKIQGSNNKINNVKATIKALTMFRPDITASVRRMTEKPEAPKTLVAEVIEKVEKVVEAVKEKKNS